jgi:hypothetical protein
MKKLIYMKREGVCEGRGNENAKNIGIEVE